MFRAPLIACLLSVPALGGIDYLQVAVDFADCMLEHGRDRYGAEHSPLFAVLLTRGAEPRIGPQPVFESPAQYDWQKELESPFRRFNYNRCLNYPVGLGAEGPHKVTLTGCDIAEDRVLYQMLDDLSRITGDGRYRAEAEKALQWWFTRTMGPAGLYPWGEHLGWDFEHECPTYFEGPGKHLFAACYHEIKDQVPFLDFLAGLPAGKTGGRTPLEKYALGVWEAHYWDKGRCIYCRHGDYTGEDDREGSLNGFPAHQGAHLRLWVKTLLTTSDAEVRRQMEGILTKVLDSQMVRAKKHGFIPFTFEPDVEGKKAKKNPQSERLGRHAAELSLATANVVPELSGKLRELAELLVGAREVDRLTDASGPPQDGKKPVAGVADLSGVETPGKHAREIIRRIEWCRRWKDPAYLDAAERQAQAARAMFCDDTCPLPKAFAGGPRKTPAGDPFPDFYFRGAELMHAFALLGEAKRELVE